MFTSESVTSHLFTLIDTYRLVDVEPGGHPPEDSRVQVLRPVGGSHYDHLTKTDFSQCSLNLKGPEVSTGATLERELVPEEPALREGLTWQ